MITSLMPPGAEIPFLFCAAGEGGCVWLLAGSHFYFTSGQSSEKAGENVSCHL